MDSLIVQIRNEISKGNSEEAIKLLQENFTKNKKIQDQILNIAGRANELEQKVLKGIISEAEAHLQSNQIRDALIRIVNQIEKKEADNGHDLIFGHRRLALFSLLGFTGIIMIMLLILALFSNRKNPLKMQNGIAQVKDSNDLIFPDLIGRDISSFSTDSLIMAGDVKYDSVKINAKCYLDESPKNCDPRPLYRIIKDKEFNYAMSIISYVESNTQNQNVLEEMDEQKKIISFLLENEHLDYAWFSFPSVRILTEKGDMEGLFTRSGHEVIKPKYESIDPLAFDDKYIIHLNDKFGLLDLNGKELIPPVLDDIYPHDFSPLILIVKNDKNGFCDNKGRIVFETRFDYVWPPDEKGFIIVSEKSKWGCIDTSGRVVLSLQYDTLGHFENGKAFVKQGRQSFFINREGRKVKNPAFD